MIATQFRHQSDAQLVGESPVIRRIEEEIERAARVDAKVLITGETGVGKDVVARLIHQASARRLARFATVNCAGVPDSLLESELFGHERGSFTGAWRDKPGLLEGAPNGTLFLDEVGEMTPRMQAVVLRFLESGEVQRVGANRVHNHANVRIIAATNRNLLEDTGTGQFRQDLYYRLNVIHIHVPPLRERREDIPVLSCHFLSMCAREYGIAPPALSPAVMDALTSYHWPGNVRQLKNVIERLMLKARGPRVELHELPSEIGGPALPSASTMMSPPGGAAASAGQEADLLHRMVDGRESFWAVVHQPFMKRDLLRTDVRAVVAEGLRSTRGSYRQLVARFNMPPADYKRFLGFLRKFDCQLPVQTFRAIDRVRYGGTSFDPRSLPVNADLPESEIRRAVAV